MHYVWKNEWPLTHPAVVSSHKITWWMIERINEYKNKCPTFDTPSNGELSWNEIINEWMNK